MKIFFIGFHFLLYIRATISASCIIFEGPLTNKYNYDHIYMNNTIYIYKRNIILILYITYVVKNYNNLKNINKYLHSSFKKITICIINI